MSIFGKNWVSSKDDYDSLVEYERGVKPFHCIEEYDSLMEYERGIKPFHNDELIEYERGIRHFQKY